MRYALQGWWRALAEGGPCRLTSVPTKVICTVAGPVTATECFRVRSASAGRAFSGTKGGTGRGGRRSSTTLSRRFSVRSMPWYTCNNQIIDGCPD